MLKKVFGVGLVVAVLALTIAGAMWVISGTIKEKDVEIAKWRLTTNIVADNMVADGQQIKLLTEVINEGEIIVNGLKARHTRAIELLDSQISGLLDNKEAWEEALGIPRTCVEYLPDGYAGVWAELHLKPKEPLKPAEPKEPTPISFTDRVQTSLKGVVHLQAPSWQGSGFVVGPNLIVTARHCVEGVESFAITTSDGHKLHATRAISDKEHDVAFIWVDDLECLAEERGSQEHDVVLHPLEVGNIADCVLGQAIYVIGSPFGQINLNSLTTGIISGVDRDWSFAGEHYGWSVAFTIDSAGHPGNSGCAVFTMDGVVRGILVGGFSPVLISVMPCDLFLADLEVIVAMFAADRYERESIGWDSYDVYEDDNECYTSKGEK